MKRLLHKLLSWCPFYRMAIGGYWYYTYIQDRTYHPSQFYRYGEDVRIERDVVISHPEKMKIGDGVLISSHCLIRASGGFHIGNYSGLGPYTTVLTTDHKADGNSVPFDGTSLVKPVIIEDCVWVGSNVAILGGVTIGEGAIVGLGSIVRKDVPPCAIVVGNPARVVGYRDKDHYYSTKNSGATRAPRPSKANRELPARLEEKYREFLEEIGYDTSAQTGHVDIAEPTAAKRSPTK